MSISNNTAFERIYTSKFESLYSKYGEFVTYRRDLAKRDIGIHLVEKSYFQGEELSPCLCWFQLKGITGKRLPAKKYDSSDEVRISLKVDHLRFWYKQLMPTYLALYIESKDLFLVTNLKKYIQKNYGDKIFEIKTKTLSISVSSNSQLDEQAFNLILDEGKIEQWREFIDLESKEIHYCIRDFGLIYNLGDSNNNIKENILYLKDWISKTRTELEFCQLQENNTQCTIWRHIEFMLLRNKIEFRFPYLDFFALPENFYEEEDTNFYFEGPENEEILHLNRGDTILGINHSNEFVIFKIGYRFNEIGLKIYNSVTKLNKMNFISKEMFDNNGIDMAPWHFRDV